MFVLKDTSEEQMDALSELIFSNSIQSNLLCSASYVVEDRGYVVKSTEAKENDSVPQNPLIYNNSLLNERTRKHLHEVPDILTLF